MPYTSRSIAHRNARDIAGAAMAASRGFVLLKRCRALLGEIDPDKPPVSATPREFRWQCRALRERVYHYSRKLAAVGEREHYADRELLRMEHAIERSLRYFHDVLSPLIEDESV